MPALLAAVSVFLLTCVTWSALNRPIPGYGRSVPAGDILRNSEEAAMDPDLWPIGWPHDGPTSTLSVVAARQVMRGHLTCDIATCPRKRAAYRTLAEAGVLAPDTRAEKHLAGWENR